MKSWIYATACTAIALGCQSASAAWFKFKIAGKVVSSDVMADGTVVPIGTRVTGSFSYDTASPYSYMTDHQTWEVGYYGLPRASHLRIKFGDHEAVENWPTATVHNDIHGGALDRVLINSSGKMILDGVADTQAYFGLTLWGDYRRGNWLTSVALPSSIDVTQLDHDINLTNGFLFSGGPDSRLLLLFSIDKISSKPCVLDGDGRLDCQ